MMMMMMVAAAPAAVAQTMMLQIAPPSTGLLHHQQHWQIHHRSRGSRLHRRTMTDPTKILHYWVNGIVLRRLKIINDADDMTTTNQLGAPRKHQLLIIFIYLLPSILLHVKSINLPLIPLHHDALSINSPSVSKTIN